jgi:hypothetical protein
MGSGKGSQEGVIMLCIHSDIDQERFLWIMEGIADWKLNPWERRFIDSIKVWWEENGYLTINQGETLEKIFKSKSK